MEKKKKLEKNTASLKQLKKKLEEINEKINKIEEESNVVKEVTDTPSPSKRVNFDLPDKKDTISLNPLEQELSNSPSPDKRKSSIIKKQTGMFSKQSNEPDLNVYRAKSTLATKEMGLHEDNLKHRRKEQEIEHKKLLELRKEFENEISIVDEEKKKNRKIHK